MAALAKAWVCGRLLVGIACSNPSESMDVSVFWESFVLSSRGLCDGMITCPDETYRVWCVCLNAIIRPWPSRGCWAMEEGGWDVKDTYTFLKLL